MGKVPNEITPANSKGAPTNCIHQKCALHHVNVGSHFAYLVLNWFFSGPINCKEYIASLIGVLTLWEENHCLAIFKSHFR